MKIYLDIGHGGADPGAVSGTRIERDMLRGVLTDRWREWAGRAGIQVVPDDRPLKDRVLWIREQAVDGVAAVVLSVHLDSGPPSAHGTTVYYASGSAPEAEFVSREWAGMIAQSWSRLTGIASRGQKPDTEAARGRLGICRDTGIRHAYVLEAGFLTSEHDMVMWTDVGGWSMAALLQRLRLEVR